MEKAIVGDFSIVKAWKALREPAIFSNLKIIHVIGDQWKKPLNWARFAMEPPHITGDLFEYHEAAMFFWGTNIHNSR
jgi:hypothetical protein